VLAGIAGVNLALALAVSAGAVPRPGADDGVRSTERVASAAFSHDALASARQPGDTTPASVHAAVSDTATTAAPPMAGAQTAAAPKVTVTTPPAAKAVAATTSAKAPTVAAPTAPPVTALPLPVGVARRVPAASEVQAALGALPTHVHSILTPSPAQVAQLGDKVCTLFDQGQTFAQVKATGLQMVTQVPLTTILPGGADWVVRTVVTLYCPGHLPKTA